jgi:hypothetical protein
MENGADYKVERFVGFPEFIEFVSAIPRIRAKCFQAPRDRHEAFHCE